MKNLKEIKLMMERLESPRLTETELNHKKSLLKKEEGEIAAGDVFVKNLKKTIQQKFKFSPKIINMPDKGIVVFYPVYLRKQLHPFFDSLMEEGAIGDFAGIPMVVTDVENKSDNTTLKIASEVFFNMHPTK